MDRKRSYRLDFIKGISIIIVILYHLGVFENGYLGVDAFFVISGYLFAKSAEKSINSNQYSFWKSIIKKLSRLWPPILIICVVSLAFGYFSMLPDDFENLCESIIATVFFANNILACITTKNYWDISNTYKPLMHTWYVGVLFQAFVLLSLIFYFCTKAKSKKKVLIGSLTVITTASFLLYWFEVGSSAQIFYYLPYRLYEITIGSLIALFPSTCRGICIEKRVESVLLIALYSALVVIVGLNGVLLHSKYSLVLVVFLVAALLCLPQNEKPSLERIIKPVTFLGKTSYSFYLWHQLFIAILYYSIVPKLTPIACVAFFTITIIVSIASYYFVECKINIVNSKHKIGKLLLCSVCIGIFISGVSFCVYNNAGVVRDIPELGIKKTDASKGLHSSYCDRPYNWNKEFQSDKVRVVVLGNSFGRDWANILYESCYSEEMEISYIFVEQKTTWNDIKMYEKRIDKSDIVFFVMHTAFEDVPDYIRSHIEEKRLYVVGDKSFGSSNGIFYSKRNSNDYFNQCTEIDEELFQKNAKLKSKYKEHYIDMISPVLVSNNEVRIFTEDQHYISQDCRHLTKYGAIYYSKILDLKWIVEGH